jgi:hypothetical protein
MRRLEMGVKCLMLGRRSRMQGRILCGVGVSLSEAAPRRRLSRNPAALLQVVTSRI